MDDELYDLIGRIEEVLRMDEAYEAAKKEFIDKLLTDVATIFVTLNEHYWLKPKQFISKTKEKLNLIADDYYDTVADLESHYLRSNEDFFQFDVIVTKCLESISEEEIDNYRKEIKNMLEEDLQAFIAEENAIRASQADYEKTFRTAIKKLFTEWLRTINNLPARAYRELDYLSWEIFDTLNQEMYGIAAALTTNPDFQRKTNIGTE